MADDEELNLSPTEIDTYLHSSDDLERFTAQVAFGDRILSLANDNTQGLGYVFDKARSAYLEAFNGFLALDLQGPDGLAKAIAAQGQMKRYTELVSWLDDAARQRDEAKDELKKMRPQPEERMAQVDELAEEQRKYYGTEPTSED